MSTAQLRRLQRVEARAAASPLPAWVEGSAGEAIDGMPVWLFHTFWGRAVQRIYQRKFMGIDNPSNLSFRIEAAFRAGAMRTAEEAALVEDVTAELAAVWDDEAERADLLRVIRREPWRAWVEGRG